MTRQERNALVRNIASRVESEEELRKRLGLIGYKGSIDWIEVSSDDSQAVLAQYYYRLHGLPVAKNGALVTIDNNYW